MGMTIYGGKTSNNVYIHDIIDNNNDVIYYSPNKKYFARYSAYSIAEEFQQQDGPAIAMFKANSDNFTPIYGQKLEHDFGYYCNDYGETTDHFSKSLTDFWQQAQKDGYDVGVELEKTSNNGKLPKGAESMMEELQNNGDEWSFTK